MTIDAQASKPAISAIQSNWFVMIGLIIIGLLLFLFVTPVAADGCEQDDPTPCPKQMTKAQENIETIHTVVFQATGQNMWGPFPDILPQNSVVPILGPISWDKSFTFPEEKPNLASVQSMPSDFCSISSAKAGQIGPKLSLVGNSSGQFGLSAHFYEFGNGEVNVHYPVEVSLSREGNITPGNMIVINTSLQALPGASISTTFPTGKIDIDALYEFHADLGLEACLDIGLYEACTDTGFTEVLPIDIPETTQTLITIDSQDIIEVDPTFGLSGSFRLPQVKTTSTYNDHYQSLGATGVDKDYVHLRLDNDYWLSKIPHIPELSYIESLEVGGVEIAEAQLDILDFSTNFGISQSQSFTFTPEVSVTLDFGQNVDFVIQHGEVVIQSGYSTQVTFQVGHRAEITLPSDLSSGLVLTPQFSLSNQFINETATIFSYDLKLEVLKLMARSAGYELTCGPWFEESWNLYTHTDTTLFTGDLTIWEVPDFEVIYRSNPPHGQYSPSLKRIFLPIMTSVSAIQ